MNVISGYDLHTRERVLSATNTDGTNPEFWQEFRGTAVWKRFVHVYGATQANLDRIVGILNTMYPDQEYFTLDQVTDVFITAIDSGGSASDPLDRKPAEIEETVQEPKPVPTDKNGRPLSAAQIQWGEFSRWSAAASSAQVKERVRTDEAYAKFVRTNLRNEMDQPIDGDVRGPLNPSLEVKSPTQAALKNERLVAFAEKFRRMSASDARKAGRADINPATWSQFQKDTEDCIRLGLL